MQQLENHCHVEWKKTIVTLILDLLVFCIGYAQNSLTTSDIEKIQKIVGIECHCYNKFLFPELSSEVMKIIIDARSKDEKSLEKMLLEMPDEELKNFKKEIESKSEKALKCIDDKTMLLMGMDKRIIQFDCNCGDSVLIPIFMKKMKETQGCYDAYFIVFIMDKLKNLVDEMKEATNENIEEPKTEEEKAKAEADEKAKAEADEKAKAEELIDNDKPIYKEVTMQEYDIMEFESYNYYGNGITERIYLMYPKGTKNYENMQAYYSSSQNTEKIKLKVHEILVKNWVNSEPEINLRNGN